MFGLAASAWLIIEACAPGRSRLVRSWSSAEVLLSVPATTITAS